MTHCITGDTDLRVLTFIPTTLSSDGFGARNQMRCRSAKSARAVSSIVPAMVSMQFWECPADSTLSRSLCDSGVQFLAESCDHLPPEFRAEEALASEVAFHAQDRVASRLARWPPRRVWA